MDPHDPRLASLSAQKRALLLKLLQQERAKAGPEGIPRVDRAATDRFPLSFAQQRLWFLDHLYPGNHFYNIPFVLRLAGRLDGAALRRCLDEIVRRHEVLRTTFAVEDGVPLQVVHPPGPMPFEALDVDGDPEPHRERERVRPFDLSREWPFRATLLRLGPDRHELLLTQHHIAGDGWSVAVLIREITTLYPAFTRGEASPLPDLAVQYVDFAAWQRRRLHGDRLDRLVSWWRDTLRGVPELELPRDLRPPATPTQRGGSLVVPLDRDLIRRAEQLARAEGATPYHVLLSVFAALLARAAGQAEFAIGTATAGRTTAEIEDLVGFFVNTLVLRADLSGRPTVRELIARTRAASLAADERQDLPFEKLVEELAPRRSLLVNPIFQVMFILQTVPFPRLELPGLAVEAEVAPTRTAKFDLYLSLEDRGPAGFVASWEYALDLFEAPTVRALALQFEALLRAALDRPDAPIDDLDPMTPAERTRVHADARGAATPFPAASTVPERFLAWADRPTTAITWGDRELSYAELYARARGLAGRLAELGVRPGVRVGLPLERSPELLVAMLATTLAGGAYVPLDPEHPPERLAWTLRDSGVTVVVTDGPAPLGTVRVDPHETGDGALVPPSPEDPAYVVYTSGSTGVPKGIVVPHRAILRLVCDTDYCQLRADDVVAQASNAAFDAATFEIWGALLHGARLVGTPRDVALTPRLLVEHLRAHGVTTLFLTTALFNQVVRSEPGAFRTLRHVLLGGEAADPEVFRECLRDGPRRLLHVYGPTETTTFATSHLVDAVPERARTIPIGRPIANTTAFVLDERRRLIAPGGVGELYIGGPGLALGYLDRPELTADRFVPSPLDAGERLYRTGDRVRLRPDGAIEFVGRVDHQVKIRGFRVELGEIDAALVATGQVEDAVTVAAEDASGTKRLVAYVTAPASDAPELVGDHVSVWEGVYDALYAAPREVPEDFDLVGWNDSATGRPIPADAMREWLDDTLAGIGRPGRVLEIGVGTGMILHAIAPGAQEYVATDFSAAAIERLAASTAHLPGVRLLHRAADDFSGLPEAWFDRVILNSVSQYFPSGAYLARVLAGALRVTRPGGTVFVGDVRSLPMLETFAWAVELERSPPTASVEDALRRARVAVRNESELAVAPGLFATVAAGDPRGVSVRVEPKRGRAVNELTRFRVQVHLDVALPPDPRDVRWVDGDPLDPQDVTGPVGFRRVPNARTEALARSLAEARGPDAPRRIGELGSDPVGVWPEQVFEVARARGLDVQLDLGAHDAAGRFDVIFRPLGTPPLPGAVAPVPVRRSANNPLRARQEAELAPKLAAALGRVLPAYMVPSTFVLLEAMPLNANGKVDRAALPSPEVERASGTPWRPPRDAVELRVAALFEECLGTGPVGIDDDFFELGGHSILAVRLVASVERALGVVLPVSTLFTHGTVAALATTLRSELANRPFDPLIPVQPRGTRPPLFLGHPAGGTTFCYVALARELGLDQPIHAFQALGLDGGDAPLTEVVAMAERYVRALRAHRPHGPYRLGGWSFGGVLGFEMAAQLQAAGEVVECVVLIDVGGPGNMAEVLDSLDDTRVLMRFSRDAGVALELDEERLRALDLEGQLAHFLACGKAQGQLPAEAETRHVRRFLECARTNIASMGRYRGSRFAGRVALFRAADRDPGLPEDPDPTRGWGAFVDGEIDLFTVPGDHTTMMQPPRVAALAEAIQAWLERLP